MALLGNLLRGRGVRPEGRDDAYEMGEDDSTVFDPTANDISNHPLFPYWKEITSVDKGDFLGEVEIVGNNARYNQLKITPGSAYDYLGEGETTTAELTYTFRNGWGTWHEASIFLTIIGENDAVTITAADEDGAVIELADGNPGEGSANLTDSGMISFTDPDLTDTHTATVTGSSSSNGTVLGMLSFAVTDDPMAAAGSVEWTYSVADGAVEFLGAGETVTETFTIEISDDFGGADTATVTVTVTGTNDGVVVTSSVLAGAVTEIADEAPGEGVEPLMAIGLIEFSDLDLTDTHTVSVTGSSSTNGAVLGGLSLALTDSTGTGAGSVEWTYSVADAAIEFLGEGETVTETFTVTIDDQKGGEAFESVTVTITGTNDAPVVQALTGTVSEDGPAIALTASFTDLDATDTHTITSDDSLTTGVVTDDGMGGFTYDPNGAFEALDDNETATDSFTYTVDDGNGGVVTETVTFTIEGVNDAPVAADDTGLPSPDPIHEDAVHVIDTADLLANDSDVDGDVLTVTATDAVSDLGAGVTLNPDGTISYDPTNSPTIQALNDGETLVTTVGDLLGAGVGGEHRLGRLGPAVGRQRRGQVRQGQRAVQIFHHPAVQAIETTALVLQGQGRAELGLAAGTLEEDHQLPRDGQGEIAAKIGFDQRQGQIYTGGDAGGGPELTVLDEDRIRVEPDAWEARRKFLAAPPMGDGAATIEQARAGQQKRATAHRCRAARDGSAGRDPVDQACIVTGAIDAPATGNDQCVQGLRGG